MHLTGIAQQHKGMATTPANETARDEVEAPVLAHVPLDVASRVWDMVKSNYGIVSEQDKGKDNVFSPEKMNQAFDLLAEHIVESSETYLYNHIRFSLEEFAELQEAIATGTDYGKHIVFIDFRVRMQAGISL